MKKNYNRLKIITSQVFTVTFVLFLLVACGPKNSSNLQSETQAVESTPALIQDLNNTIEVNTQKSETTAQTLLLTDSEESQPANPAVKLNPPHGEPGHRCDIAVGAPLDSPVKSSTVQTITTETSTPVNSTVNSSAVTTVPVNTATVNSSGGRVGPTIEKTKDFKPTQRFSYIPVNNSTSSQTAQINPPHGEPGHRCDIPVGDPLPTASTSTTVKINPAHGQPGHRCDIPVGDPLPS